jgi:hypothetical protein
MFHRAKRLNFRRFNFDNTFVNFFYVRFGIAGFHIREFPQVRVDGSGRTLPDQEASVSLNHKGNETSRGGGLAFAQVWKFPDAALSKRDAELVYLANFAPRISRRANQRAEFHEGLVEAGAGHKKRPNARPDPFDRQTSSTVLVVPTLNRLAPHFRVTVFERLSQTDSLLVQRLNLSVDFGKCGRCGVSISSFVSCVSFHTFLIFSCRFIRHLDR